MSLGLERAGMETIAFCEIEPYCRRVLAKHWPDVKLYEDIRSLDATTITADLVCGGYPCQPFSQAGKRQGENDDRHLWPEMFRIIRECRPSWVLGENVAGHISMGLDSVLSDLESQGYTCQTFVIPACAVNAPHRRDRTWVVGHAEGQRCRETREYSSRSTKRPTGSSAARQVIADAKLQHGSIAMPPRRGGGGNEYSKNGRIKKNNKAPGCCAPSSDTMCIGSSRSRGAKGSIYPASKRDRQVDRTINDCRWPIEPSVGRVANGVPGRVDRLRSLGNAVVPQVVEQIGRAIMVAENL